MSDIVQDILSVAAQAKPWEWEPDHPQYIEGRLYLTPEQWQAVIDQSPPRRPGYNYGQTVWGIPVDIVSPGDQITLPSGRTLAYPPILGALVVCDPPPWVKYDPAGPGVTQVGRTRL